MKFTIYGANGFIGSHLVRKLRRDGHEVDTPSRGDAGARGTDAGHVIYAAGLTGDFRKRPFDTVDAHVSNLTNLLRDASFSSWLYLSSTRVYGGIDTDILAREDTVLRVLPDLDGLYNLSKLLGEALCLSQPRDNIRVARLSNVYGRGQSRETFLGEVLDKLSTTGSVTLRGAPSSSKDYVSIDDVVEILPALALKGQQRLYNVASGKSTTHMAIASRLRASTSCVVDFVPDAPKQVFPEIDISRLRNEFGYSPKNIVDDLQTLMIETLNDKKQN